MVATARHEGMIAGLTMGLEWLTGQQARPLMERIKAVRAEIERLKGEA